MLGASDALTWAWTLPFGKRANLEPKLKARWQRLVQKHYAEFVGKEIPESYLPALYKHGLMISRYSKDIRRRFRYC